MDHLSNKNPGDPILADDWNALIHLVKRNKEQNVPPAAFPFELKTSLDPGDYKATAYPRIYDRATQGFTTDLDANTFTVYDATGNRRSIGRDDYSGTDGAFGSCVRIHSNLFMILDIHEIALLAKAKAKGAITSTAGGSVDNIEIMCDGQTPITDGTGALSAGNPANWYLPDNRNCIIARNGDGWDILVQEMVAKQVDINQKVENLTFYQHWQTFRMNIDDGVALEWADWHTGTAC